MTVYRIAPDFAGRAQIVCESCGHTERYWDERQAAKWKAAHTAGCPGHKPTIDQEGASLSTDEMDVIERLRVDLLHLAGSLRKRSLKYEEHAQSMEWCAAELAKVKEARKWR